MTWMTRSSISLSANKAQTTMDGGLRELVEVKALRPFGLGDALIQPGDVVQVSRARGEYLVFLQLATWL